MSARLVGLDVGTSSLKGLVLSEEGRVLAQASRDYPVATPRPGWAEQDPELWWEAAQAVLAELDAPRADAIGLAGQMHGLVALDAGGRSLRPAILWNDARTGAQCAEIERRVGVERLVALTGNRALAGFTAPKLLWMAEHEPDLHARIASILLPKDYVRLRLTGEHASDVADLSGTLLLDVAARDWSAELLDALSIPREWLPRVLESAEVSGVAFTGGSDSLAGGSARHDRSGGVPVAAGAGDQAAGAVGVGALGSGGPLSLVLGTSGVVFGGEDAYRFDPDGRVHAFCHALPGTWHTMGVVLSAGGALAWLQQALGDASIEALLQEAAAVAPGADGVLFAPYLAGERTPHPDPDVRGGFVGLSLQHGRGQLVRAVLEGVAFALRESLLLVDPQRTRTVARVSGGGARSPLWLEIVAAVLDLPLELCAVTEAAAQGAALLGGVAAGLFPDVHTAARATVRLERTVTPRRDWVETYGPLAARYAELYPALHPLAGSRERGSLTRPG
ncbi:xylulokinase [Conexibacter sp. CPCC 206217]|uniref:xylulokinase n=1 Tax=Conexibacter sp. CPCC 206217 TaxID=3064574 RepID=UPI002717078F|nr:xylulokinase [Conexibacter sp. CPCC 206217]MDO8211302.1 xylulokinase [Conexibacter sp. CPCC 206217]